MRRRINKAAGQEIVVTERGLPVARLVGLDSSPLLERLLDPKAVPDGLLPEMMAVFFSGLRARAAGGPAPAPPEASR